MPEPGFDGGEALDGRRERPPAQPPCGAGGGSGPSGGPRRGSRSRREEAPVRVGAGCAVARRRRSR